MDGGAADNSGAKRVCPAQAGRANLWLPSRTLRWDLVAIIAVALVVQLTFRQRADWASHVLAGGAVVIISDAALGCRLGAWATTFGAVTALVLGVASDLTVSGPFDPSDVAFTLAGTLVVTGRGLPGGPSATLVDADRRLALACGLALLGIAVYYRYGIRRGP